METIQVTERAGRLLKRFGTSTAYGNCYADFQAAMLDAFGEVVEHLEYFNVDMQITGKDLAPLFALQQYADLAAELHKGFEAQEKSKTSVFAATD